MASLSTALAGRRGTLLLRRALVDPIFLRPGCVAIDALRRRPAFLGGLAAGFERCRSVSDDAFFDHCRCRRRRWREGRRQGRRRLPFVVLALVVVVALALFLSRGILRWRRREEREVEAEEEEGAGPGTEEEEAEEEAEAATETSAAGRSPLLPPPRRTSSSSLTQWLSTGSIPSRRPSPQGGG